MEGVSLIPCVLSVQQANCGQMGAFRREVRTWTVGVLWQNVYCDLEVALVPCFRRVV